MQLGIGKRIKQRRNDLGLTQEELAKRMGYKSKAAICKVENGEDNITSDRVSKFANALNCSPAYLMGWEEQIKRVQEQLEPLTKQMAKYGKQISDSLSYELDLDNGIRVEIESLTQSYDNSQLIRAMKFAKAFLSASPERQKIALEILQQSHQADS